MKSLSVDSLATSINLKAQRWRDSGGNGDQLALFLYNCSLWGFSEKPFCMLNITRIIMNALYQIEIGSILSFCVAFQSCLSGHKNIIKFHNSNITMTSNRIYEVLILMQYYKGRSFFHLSNLLLIYIIKYISGQPCSWSSQPTLMCQHKMQSRKHVKIRYDWSHSGVQSMVKTIKYVLHVI